jgi:hypothetical protein
MITWLMSALTIYTLWQAGNKKVRAWVVGLLNQSLWLWFIISREEWGLLPMTGAITFIYARNLIRWRKSEMSDNGLDNSAPRSNQ